jgi:hypothetical protein
LTMWPFRRREASTAPMGTAEYYHSEVSACMDALNPKFKRLRRRYSDPAIAAMHTVAALSVCIRDGHMTRDEARDVIRRISELEFGVAAKRGTLTNSAPT